MDPSKLERILADLHQAGLRRTQARQAVVRVLLEAEDALRPEDVLDRARLHCRSLGLVTVYRSLALLEQMGFARRVHGEAGCHGYAAASLSHSHYIVCRVCRQVVEFPGRDDLARLIKRVARQTGFAVDDHLLELVGRCPQCQAG